MHRSLFAKRLLFKPGWSLVLLTVFITLAWGSTPQADSAAERQRAIELFDSLDVQALPLLEKVALSYPNDPAVLSRLGFALFANSMDQRDPAMRQKTMDRARAILLKSRTLGDNNSLSTLALDTLAHPELGQVSLPGFKSAIAAIREGEAAFRRRDMDKALAAYKRAYDLYPRLYEASLFAGDVEFIKGKNSNDVQFRNTHLEAAGTWFAKAIAINPERSTAYQYWGDALDAQGKMNEALERFLDAIIADPYSGMPYAGLTQWAQRHRAKLGHPQIEPTNASPASLNSADGSSNWSIYTATRAAWARSEFFKNYPGERQYRHSLKEETTALRMVAEASARDLKSGKVKTLEPSLAMLVKLNEDGFLEPYVLFARPDEGIVRDYAAYRATNRDQLKRYWIYVVILPG